MGAFLAAGWSVRAAARTLPSHATPAAEWRSVGDIGAACAWSGIAEAVDCIVHAAARVHVTRETAANSLTSIQAVNVAATRRLAEEAVRAGVRRFVFVSSIGVNGQRTLGRAFSETDPVAPETPYAVSKWEAESALKQISSRTTLELTVVRPPLVYGPEAPGNFGRLVSWIRRGRPLPLGRVTGNRRSLVYVGNLASALVACASHAGAANELFLVADDEVVSTAELIERIAVAAGRRPNLWPVPPAILRIAGRARPLAALQPLLDSLEVDNRYLRRQLGWKPPFTLDEGLRVALARDQSVAEH